MDAFVGYLLQNWALILVLLAFAIMLKITVFLERKTVIRMYVLILFVFALSIIVFTEFYFSENNLYPNARLILMAIRYSATPIIIALILYTLVKRARWYTLIPAFALIIVNVISIFTGIVFGIDDGGNITRGAVWLLPYIAVGLYAFFLVLILVLQSNKQITEIIPIAFLAFAFASGIALPFIIKQNYFKIFCTTIAISLFVYYVFQILQLTKKDALTGLLNRQAYYAEIRNSYKDINALISIDMNGLKTINDNGGHHAGDVALETLATCFFKAARAKQFVYRLGGDEFVIVCMKTNEDELKGLIERIKNNVSETPYACSIGYSYSPDGSKSIDEMIKESDEMMYLDKANYYKKNNINRRHE